MNLYEAIADNIKTMEEFDKHAEELGIKNMSPYYYIDGAPDCHTIEQADAYYDSLPPDQSSVNYKRDKGDLTPEQFQFLDEHRDLVHQSLCLFGIEMMQDQPLD